MAAELDINMIRKAIDNAKKHQVRPGVVKTDAEAVLFNEKEKALARLFGLKPRVWKIGDEYYLANMHPEQAKQLNG